MLEDIGQVMNSPVGHDEMDSLVTALEAVLLHLKRSRGLDQSIPPLTRQDIVMAAPSMRDSEIDLIHFLSKYNGEVASDGDICDALGIRMGSLKVYACHSRSTLDRFGITPSIIRKRNVGYRISRHAILGLLRRSKADFG